MNQLKKYKGFLLTVLLIITANITTFACEVCNKNQPKIFRGITHGGGPQSNWDYFVVISMVLITVYTLYATVRCFMKPKKENQYNYIKNTILTPQ